MEMEEIFQIDSKDIGRKMEVILIAQQKLILRQKFSMITGVGKGSHFIREQAKDYLSSMVDSYQKKYAYLSVNGGGCSGFTYKWDMVDNDENGTVIDDLLVLDQMAEMFVMGCTVDYVKELGGSYLKVINPNAKAQCGCGESFGV